MTQCLRRPRRILSGPTLALGVILSALLLGFAEGANSPQSPQFPHMRLERQFAGPLKDTLVQRWRDPVDGTVCYIYLPVAVMHSAPLPNGLVQYGGNSIGSISCFASVQIGLPLPPK